MKKRIGSLCTALALMLSGCSKLPEPPQLMECFTSEITFTVQSLTGTASLSKTADRELTLELLTPETISGCRISMVQEEITLSFGDVSSALSGSLPDGALITVLGDALSAQAEGVQTVFLGPDWAFSGTLSKAAGDYLLTVSDTGAPLELQAQLADITVSFLRTEPISSVSD